MPKSMTQPVSRKQGLISNNSGPGKSRSSTIASGINNAARLILNLRITLFFYIAYVVVNYVYIILLRPEALNYNLVFIVSPFNILEILSPAYTSSTQGLVENFGFVVFMILIAELYSRYSMVRLKRYLSIDGAFFLSIAATYLMSALWWWRTGVPGSGTSILAFSILVYLAFSCLLDIRQQLGRARKRGSEAVRGVIWIAALVSSIGFAPTYILGNPHYAIHVAGASIFTAMGALVIVVRMQHEKALAARAHVDFTVKALTSATL